MAELPPCPDDQMAKFMALGAKINEVRDLLTSIGNSRELALARTKIDEAMLWSSEHFATHYE